MDNYFKKNNIGLDLISNPKKIKSINNSSNIEKNKNESKEFNEAKQLIIQKINKLNENELNFTPNNELDTTIHVLFKYLLYKPYITNIYNNIKQKEE